MINLTMDGPIAYVQLARPKKMNAMGLWFWDGMAPIFQQIDEASEIRAVVLSGAGRAFSVGLDLFDVMPSLPFGQGGPDGRRQAQLHALIRRWQDAVTCVERCRVPVVAAIHGYCIGGGIDLISACDIRVCAADAIFSVREVKMGIVADIGTLQRLPRIIPAGVARELALTGRDFDAAFSEKIGLVSQVLPTQQAAFDAAIGIATEIAENAPLAVEGTKRVLNETHRASIDRELEYVATWNAAHLITKDLGRAVEAFASKSKPAFEGD